jgi:zinc protease
MRSALNLIVVAAICTVSGPQEAGVAGEPRAGARAPVFAYPIQKTTLENGLTVMSVPFDSPGIIAYYTIVRTGSRNEVEKGLSGFAHFFEHMMFRGTDRFPAEKYNDVLKALGADSNAYTNQDCTCYHMTIPATALATAVQIEADRFQNLKYDEPSFQKEARAVLGEYNKSASSPFLKLNEALQNTAYVKHTYKHTTIGFLDDVKDMPNQYTYSKVFFDRWYRPENCTLIVAGDVKQAELISLVKLHYGGWKRGGSNVAIPDEPAQTEPRSARLTWPLPTLPTLLLGYHIPEADPRNADMPVLNILAQLVFGETSVLYEELVLKEQKVVQLSGEASPNRDPGLFEIMARVREPGDLPVVRKRIGMALAGAAKAPVDAAKLRAIKSHLRYQFAGELESADAVAEAIATAVALTGRPESINELFDAYDRVTAADLMRVAGQYFQAANETSVILETEVKK